MYMDSPFMTMKDDGSILTELDIRVPKEQFEDRMNRSVIDSRDLLISRSCFGYGKCTQSKEFA